MEPARTSIAWITNKPLRSQGYRYLRIAIVLYSTVIHIDQSFGTHHFIVAPPPYRFQLSAHFVPSGPHTDAGCEIIYWIHYSFIHALCSFILLPCHPDASVDRPPRPVNLIDPIFYIQGIRGLHLAGCKWHFFTLKFKRVRGENVEKHVHSLYGGSEVREFCVRSGIRGLRNTSKQGCLNLPPERTGGRNVKLGSQRQLADFVWNFGDADLFPQPERVHIHCSHLHDTQRWTGREYLIYLLPCLSYLGFQGMLEQSQPDRSKS